MTPRSVRLCAREVETGRNTVAVDKEQARRLRYLALRKGSSFEKVVEQALEEYLRRHGLEPGFGVEERESELPEAEWQARFDAVLGRLRAGAPPSISPEEIEAEITAAREEARRELAARRPASSA